MAESSARMKPAGHFCSSYYAAELGKLHIPRQSRAFLQRYPDYSKTFLASSTSPTSPSSSSSSFEGSPPGASFPAVEVRWIGEGKGKGLFATRDLFGGEAIFSESPMVTIQDTINRLTCDVCTECSSFLGTLAHQLRILQDTDAAIHDTHDTPLPELPHLSNANVNDGVLSDIVHCRGGCNVVYCSEDCEELSWFRYHKRLCRGAVTDHSNPLFKLEAYAIQHNEHLRMVAKILAHVLEDISQGKKMRERGEGEMVSDGSIQATALLPYTVLEKQLWWDVHPFDPDPCDDHDDLPEGEDDGEEEEKGVEEDSEGDNSSDVGKGKGKTSQVERLSDEEEQDLVEMERKQRRMYKKIVQDGSRLLAAALDPAGEHPDLFSCESVGLLLGALDMNGVDLIVHSPISQYLRFICKLPEKDRATAFETLKPLLKKIKSNLNGNDDECAGNGDDGAEGRGESSKAERSGAASEDEEEDESEEDESNPRDELAEEFKLNEREEDVDLDHLPDDVDFDVLRELGWTFDFPDCSGTGLYAISSTMNHSCNPNAFFYKREGVDRTNDIVLFAARNIKKGEEISISYINNAMDYDDRQALLEYPYRFTCICEKCKQEKAKLDKYEQDSEHDCESE